jgi:hypothetical protein
MATGTPPLASLRQDPLLGIARAILTFLLGLSAFVGVVLLLAVPAVLLNQDKVVAEFGRVPEAAAAGDIVGAVLAVMMLVAVLAALSFGFVRHLRRIVDTVRQGDPFTPENAMRLRAMAWLSIAVQLAALAAGALTMWLEEATKELQANFDVSIGGILLPLVLFILARVFRRGAEMRDELEGTV